jgi:hypothetical protein
MQCAISSLALQERYSLVSACNFLVSPKFPVLLDIFPSAPYRLISQSSLIHRSSIHEELAPDKTVLIQRHGRSIMRAILCGFAGITPRSATPNLIELLSTLVTRCLEESKVWIADILFAVSCFPYKWRFVRSRVSSLIMFAIGRLCAI